MNIFKHILATPKNRPKAFWLNTTLCLALILFGVLHQIFKYDDWPDFIAFWLIAIIGLTVWFNSIIVIISITQKNWKKLVTYLYFIFQLFLSLMVFSLLNKSLWKFIIYAT